MKNFERKKGNTALRLRVYSILMNNKNEFELDEQEAMKMSYYVSSTFMGVEQNDDEIKSYVKLALEAIENDNKFKECIRKFDDTTPLSTIKETVKEYKINYVKINEKMKNISHYSSYSPIVEKPNFKID
jgi:hypothetical protein